MEVYLKISGTLFLADYDEKNKTKKTQQSVIAVQKAYQKIRIEIDPGRVHAQAQQ